MSRLNSSLCEASFIGDIDSVKELIKKKANIHYANDLPLRYAAKKGHLEVIKYLISLGANVCADTEGDNALDNSSANGHLDTVKYLIYHGATITQKTIDIANDWRFFDVEEYLTKYK